MKLKKLPLLSLYKILLIFILSVMFYSCNSAPDVEPTDQNRFGNSNGSSVPTTNSALSLSKSYVNFTTSKMIEGESATVKLYALNSNSQLLSEGGLTVTFEVTVGTSSGSFSATANPDGDGYYTATFTATTSGSVSRIMGKINGSSLTSNAPTVLIAPGAYYRDISLDMATDKDDYQTLITLNSSNFTYAYADAAGDDLRFVHPTTFVEYDYYIDSWTVGGTSRVYVKLPDTGMTSMRMYYGNSNLSAASSKETTFVSDVARDNYVELSPLVTNHSMRIVNLGDTEMVDYIKNDSSPGSVLISQSVANLIPNTRYGVYTSSAPLVGRIDSATIPVDNLTPFIFANTKTGFGRSGGTDRFSFYNPSSSTASVTIRSYDSVGTLTSTTPVSVNPNTFVLSTTDINYTAVIESDIPVLTYSYTTANGYGMTLMPASTEIYGVSNRGANIGITTDATSGTIYYSNGTSASFGPLNRGRNVNLTASAGETSSLGVRVVADKPVVANSYNPLDGVEAVSFYPESELAREYMIPVSITHALIVCKETVVVTLTYPDNVTTEQVTCTASGSFPGYNFFTAGLGYPEAIRLSGSKNFYVMYEYGTLDESNLTGWKHNRAYSYPAPVSTISSEQQFR
jgi:hypothetical protein